MDHFSFLPIFFLNSRMACECRSSGDDGDGDGENDKKKREREHTFGKNAKERKETRGDKEKGGMKRR